MQFIICFHHSELIILHLFSPFFFKNGGLNVFMQAFVAEAQAILKAHVLAIGGNALVSYQLNEIVLLDNPHKHQVGYTQLNQNNNLKRVLLLQNVM